MRSPGSGPADSIGNRPMYPYVRFCEPARRQEARGGQMRLQRALWVALVAAVAAVPAMPARAQNNPFLGDWNITGDAPNTGNIYWLQVKNNGGTLSALFLDRGGSPV